MAGNYRKLQEMAGNYRKWQEMTGNEGNDRKWQEMTGNDTSGNVRKLWQKSTSRMKLEKTFHDEIQQILKLGSLPSKWFLGPRERPRGQKSVVATIFLKSRFFLKSGFLKSRQYCISLFSKIICSLTLYLPKFWRRMWMLPYVFLEHLKMFLFFVFQGNALYGSIRGRDPSRTCRSLRCLHSHSTLDLVRSRWISKSLE